MAPLPPMQAAGLLDEISQRPRSLCYVPAKAGARSNLRALRSRTRSLITAYSKKEEAGQRLPTPDTVPSILPYTLLLIFLRTLRRNQPGIKANVIRKGRPVPPIAAKVVAPILNAKSARPASLSLATNTSK